jgi:drug/metabolite transporter (DMT)-like permease
MVRGDIVSGYHRPMDIATACAVIAASLLHASWHALVKTSGDRVVALAGMNVVSGAVALLALPFVAIPGTDVFVVIGVSVLMHGCYKVFLARLYDRADLGVGYPLARGMTPLIATVFGAMWLKELPAVTAMAGIATISAGIVLLAMEKAGRGVDPRTAALALLTGTAVAGYSVLDAYGIRLAGDWLSFTAWLVLLDSGAFVLYTVLRRPAAVAAWTTGWRHVLISGGLGITAFAIFLWALGRAPVGSVSALRETSVVFAALIGTYVLHEQTTRLRTGASLLVMAGVALIAISH